MTHNDRLLIHNRRIQIGTSAMEALTAFCHAGLLENHSRDILRRMRIGRGVRTFPPCRRTSDTKCQAAVEYLRGRPFTDIASLLFLDQRSCEPRNSSPSIRLVRRDHRVRPNPGSNAKGACLAPAGYPRSTACDHKTRRADTYKGDPTFQRRRPTCWTAPANSRCRGVWKIAICTPIP